MNTQTNTRTGRPNSSLSNMAFGRPYIILVRLSEKDVMYMPLVLRLMGRVNRIGQISNHFIEDLRRLAVLVV